MCRTLTGGVLGLACLLLAGCSGVKGYPKYFDDYNQKFLDQIYGRIFQLQAQETTGKKYQCEKDTLCGKYFECLRESNSAMKLELRNEIVSELMVFIDLQYNDFRASLHFENSTGRFVTDVLPIGLTGAGVLATTEAAKNTLLAIATGVGGVKSSYEKSVLFDMLMPAIIGAMDDKRATIKATIMTGLKSPYADYPIAEAISDVNEYFLAGTVPGAIDALTTKKIIAAKSDTKLLLADKILALQATASMKTLEQKKTILQELLPAKIKLQPEEEALLQVRFKYQVGGENKSADVSGALTYLLSRITDSDSYDYANTAVLGVK